MAPRPQHKGALTCIVYRKDKPLRDRKEAMTFGDRISNIVNTFVFDLLEAIFTLLAAVLGGLAVIFAAPREPRNQ